MENLTPPDTLAWTKKNNQQSNQDILSGEILWKQQWKNSIRIIAILNQYDEERDNYVWDSYLVPITSYSDNDIPFYFTDIGWGAICIKRYF